MLTESVSDPRRANWLTISSMSDDMCWPDEPSTTRPNWELEAEILRLTTRLMMREGELRQVKSQLKTQTTKTQQLATAWRRKMEEKDEQMKDVLLQKDAEMQTIVSQLLLFEAELRQEQSRIECLLTEKDAEISDQLKEMERLRRPVETKRSSGVREQQSETVLFVLNKETELQKQFVQTRHSNYLVSDTEVKNAILRAESKNCTDGRPMITSRSSSSDTSDMDTSKVTVYQSEELEDSGNAVQKLKDGLAKIRAIQDVTNVQSVDYAFDSVFSIEKKRTPYKAPQKMKDLKAKRINTHKIQRTIITQSCGQAIL